MERASLMLLIGREHATSRGINMIDFAKTQGHATAIAKAYTEFGTTSYEAGKTYFEKLASAKSPVQFLELTTEYIKSANEHFVLEARKIGQLYKDFALDVSLVSQAKPQ